MSACVQGFVGELNDGYRAVLLLHDVFGLSTPEIAAALADTPGAVKIRLHRARTALRSSLNAACSFSHDQRGTLVCDPNN
jgi:RNA polymerase sigma-70 factor, ECF subfamily